MTDPVRTSAAGKGQNSLQVARSPDPVENRRHQAKSGESGPADRKTPPERSWKARIRGPPTHGTPGFGRMTRCSLVLIRHVGLQLRAGRRFEVGFDQRRCGFRCRVDHRRSGFFPGTCPKNRPVGFRRDVEFGTGFRDSGGRLADLRRGTAPDLCHKRPFEGRKLRACGGEAHGRRAVPYNVPVGGQIPSGTTPPLRTPSESEPQFTW